jgi:hypothetical protein
MTRLTKKQTEDFARLPPPPRFCWDDIAKDRGVPSNISLWMEILFLKRRIQKLERSVK